MAQGEQTQELVREMTAEYIERKGYVTCEFSCHHENLGPCIAAIKEVEDDLCRAGAKWIMFPCDTCEEQHGEGFLHIEIFRASDWKPSQG